MSTQTRRNSPPSLWEQAVILWNNMVLGFGHPHDLMRWGWMRALEHRALSHWLRDLEALVRRAIRIDAETCELPELKPRAMRPARRSSTPRSPEDMPRFRRSYSDDCTTWKVSFRMSTPGLRKRRGPRKNSPPSERRRCRNLAYRIEALRRAINYRDDYVLRYARRLARIEEVRLRVMADDIASTRRRRRAPALHQTKAQPACTNLVTPSTSSPDRRFSSSLSKRNPPCRSRAGTPPHASPKPSRSHPCTRDNFIPRSTFPTTPD